MLKKTIIILFSIFFFVIAGFIIFQKRYEKAITTPVDFGSKDRIIFKIEKGEDINSITKKLKKKNIISSKFFFNLYLKREKLGKDIQAGKFVLKKSLTIPEIAIILKNAVLNEIPITIPEGFTIQDIDALLLKKDAIKAKGQFEKCAEELEGYLFPDTYFINIENFDCKKFAQRMQNTLEQKIDTKMRKDIKDKGKTIKEIIIMASLIEKETRRDDERALVSGILWKRLNTKIPLAVDASTRYYKKTWNMPLTAKDFDEDNLYNLRKHLGFPPSPICNPGLKSILAAIYPKKSKYFYYLHDNKGNIHYAVTHDKHVENKHKYLR